MNLHDENGKLVNFCVPLTGSDEEKRAIAIEVIDKSVEIGAELFNGVRGIHESSEKRDPTIWGFVGVNASAGTWFADMRSSFDESAKTLSLNEFRAYYDKWKSEQWPDENSPRNQAVGQNGNTAEHYDNVSNPSHYQLMPGVEVKHVREAILNNAPDGIPYNQIDDWSRAWEYLTRMWGKNGLEDAKKARVYLDWLIEKMEKAE